MTTSDDETEGGQVPLFDLGDPVDAPPWPPGEQTVCLDGCGDDEYCSWCFLFSNSECVPLPKECLERPSCDCLTEPGWAECEVRRDGTILFDDMICHGPPPGP